MFFLINLANVGDNLTTYLCLTHESGRFYEANPTGAFMFNLLGLGPGLVVEGIICLIATYFLVRSYQESVWSRVVMWMLLLLTTGAVANNLYIMNQSGLFFS